MSPSRHKTPLLGWHPPAELAAWARKEAGRRGVPLSQILTEALAAYQAADGRPADLIEAAYVRGLQDAQ